MATLTDVINKGNVLSENLETLVLNDRKLLKSSIEKLESDIMSSVKNLKTLKKNLESPKVNLKISQKIHSDLKGMFKETYGNASIRSVNGYNDAVKYIKKNFKDLNIVTDFTGIDKTMISELKKNSLKTYMKYGMDAQEKIVQSMYNSVLARGKFSDLVNEISASLTGKLSKTGKPLSQYAELWANDGLMNFHQTVTLKKGEDAGLDTYVYIGNVMNSTRDFCRRRINKTYTKKEIESWTTPWAGRSGPALTFRGGYNCRHHWQPVESSIVEEDKKEKKERKEELKKPFVLTAKDTLREAELRISKGKLESGIIIDPKTGKTILEKKGTKSTVSFSKEEVELFEDNIFTHNHPSGTSFSLADILLGVRFGAKEIRACTRYNGIYRMRIHPSMKGLHDEVDLVYNMVYTDVYKDFLHEVKIGKISVKDANLLLHDKVWEQVSTFPDFEGKLLYTKEKMWKAPVIKNVPVIKKVPVIKEIPEEGFDKMIAELGEAGKLKGSFEGIFSDRRHIRIIKRRFEKAGNTISDLEAKSYRDAIYQFSGDADVYTSVNNYNKYLQKGTIKQWKKDYLEDLLAVGLEEADILRIINNNEKIALLINKYIEDTVDFSKNRKLYRGGSTFKDLDNWKVGDDLTFSGTSSWSTDKKIAGEFAERLSEESGNKPFIFILEDGRNVRSASLAEFSQYMEEKEVILGRNSVFKLIKKEKQGDGYVYYIKGVDNTIRQPETLFQELIPRSKLSPLTDYYRLEGTWYQKGKEVSEKIAKKLKSMAVPPAWENVLATLDEKVKVMATGKDKVGKWQARYSQKHIGQKAIEKFDRVKLFNRDMSKILKNIEDGILQYDDKAMLLKLEYHTGIRVGSKMSFETKKRAYGLTTLKHEHIKIEGNKIIFDFVAKKGIPVHYEVVDDVLAEWIFEKKKMTKIGDSLFPKISGNTLNSYLQKLSDGKKYTVKDFRTYHGTRIAVKELKKYEGIVLSSKEKQEVIKNVSTTVSKFLHNTPVMAKKSYISPMVWEIIGGL